MIENNTFVKEILADKEIALIGFADLSEIVEEQRYGYKYGISIAIALSIFPSTTKEPAIEYYNEYRRVSSALRIASNYLAEKIEERGYKAYSLAGERQNQEYITLLPYKTLATRAGIGWIGKSATLITKEYGNAVRLNGVLTDMPIITSTPINQSLCGKCNECVRNCPGNSIKNKLWDIHTGRDELINPYECKKTVIERGKIWNVTEGSCGICISSCPWTRKYIKSRTK